MEAPFEITPRILAQLSEITRIVGFYEGLLSPTPQPILRKQNRIRSIQGSLAIEGNTLSLEQVTALIDGKRVMGPKRDIIEVQNAIEVYEQVGRFKPLLENSLLKAHGIFMRSLVEDAGSYRNKNVGILKGTKVVHAAPQAKMVPQLMKNLFGFLRNDKSNHPIIKSCYFHYELEFIHPFSDGNGRVGRFWQYVILVNYHPLFELIPIESIIQQHQAEYYKTLAIADQEGHSTAFIEFCLTAITEALNEFVVALKPDRQTSASRLDIARNQFATDSFSRKDYLSVFKTLSTASASRDLAYGVKDKLLRKRGDKALARYHFTWLSLSNP